MWFERLMIVVGSLNRDFVPAVWRMSLSDRLGLDDLLRQHRTLFDAVVFVRPVPAADFDDGDARIGRRRKRGQGMNAEMALYGLLAEFEKPGELVAAARQAYAAGYRRMDAYTPFPVEDLAEALGREKTGIPALVLTGGIIGGSAVISCNGSPLWFIIKINVGGRPLHSWPSYIPITFELTILCAALFGVVGMLALNRLPRLHHPVFGAPHFDRASQDRFFLCVEAADPLFDSHSHQIISSKA